MISILGKFKKFDSVSALTNDMRTASLLTPQTLLIMIRKYAAVHDIGKANSTFYALRRFKSFNIILNGWCNVVGDLREGKQIWKEMEERGILRDVYSYSSIMSCYSKAGNVNVVFRHFDKMKALEIEPDRKVYRLQCSDSCSCKREAFVSSSCRLR
ncbi:Hypothetical predicted protein [Olea europaea subsp. europaea]|uniref:Pentatricopeptide repeat-containing protein n=1 Tax=Olea europaea subsp. europaea TaxID=158383 RepID=A0A8S0RZ77_OLEEU|nr:Hypothetical predicted protein [Olea europaea subsp. europaea]